MGMTTVAIPDDKVDYLIATAARAPSVHNTQPWRFYVSRYVIELYADPRRKLLVDPIGREMIISCGAALFGLRLAIRSLGYMPEIELLPDPPRLLARVRLGAEAPMTDEEWQLLQALPHRHTHRGPFDDRPLPYGLLAGLQRGAFAEGATLALVEPGLAYQRLADIVAAASRRQDLDPVARAEVRHWVRAAGSMARDGIPARAYPGRAFPEWAGGQRGRLRQRDFGQGRGPGALPVEGPSAARTAVLVTGADRPSDWLRAGQALHRLLAHAADRWVFASLYTQPMEATAIRDLIRRQLALPGSPQMLLQFGPARTTQATARRPPEELIEPR
jgi:nitroreductase